MWERYAGTNAASVTTHLARTVNLLPGGPIDRRKVVTRCEEALKASKSDPHARLALASACYRAGDFERAAQECHAIVESKSGKATRTALPVAAMAYHALGRRDDARQAFDEASALVEQSLAPVFNKKSPNWVVDKGVPEGGAETVWEWLDFLRYYREAQTMLGISSASDDVRPLVARARALAGLRRNAQADREYVKALELSPDKVAIQLEAHRNRGYLFAEKGDFRQSAEHFGKACALDPNDSDLWRFYAAATAAARDMTEYRRICAAMLEQFGDTKDRGQAYDLVHTCVLVPEAVEDISRVLLLAELASAHFVGATRMQGAAYYRAGHHAEALSAFQRAEKGQQIRAFDMCFMAMAHEGLGQHEKAQRQLAEADAWMNEADEQELDDLTGLTPHWGHWHERYDARRLAAEARELIEGGPHN
jgi:tetratricopeptide (TPR) repeat protein